MARRLVEMQDGYAYYTYDDPRTKGTAQEARVIAASGGIGQDDDDLDDDWVWESLLRAVSEPSTASVHGFISPEVAALIKSIPVHELDLLLAVLAEQPLAGVARRQGITAVAARQRYSRIKQRSEKESALLDALTIERITRTQQRKREEWIAKLEEARRQRSHFAPASPRRNALPYDSLPAPTSLPPSEEIKRIEEELAYWQKHERIAEENVALASSSVRVDVHGSRYWMGLLRQAQGHIARITEQLSRREA